MTDKGYCRRMKLRMIALAGAITFSALPVLAHHSASQFDATKVVTIKGVVKEFQYSNPHSWLIVEVLGPGGRVSTWGFEAEGPEVLLRSGIRRSDFPVGTSVTITAHPMLDGRFAGTWIKAVRADGKVFDLEPKTTGSKRAG